MNRDTDSFGSVYIHRSSVDARVEVSMLVGGGRMSANRELVVDGLASDDPDTRARAREMLFESRPSQPGPDLGRSWSADLWLLPARLLHSSRAVHFEDIGDDFRERRQSVVQDYLEVTPAPIADELIDGPAAMHVEPQRLPDRDLAEVMLSRRTPRRLVSPVSWEALSGVLWTTFAYPRRHRHPELSNDPQEYFESFGSAFDVLLAVVDVPDVEPGWYWYRLTDSALVQVAQHAQRTIRIQMNKLSSFQGTPRGCAAAVVLVARLDRYRWRYRHDRALRHVYVDAGRIGQYIALLGTGFGLETWFCSPLNQSVLSPILSRNTLDDDPLYAIFLGASPV